MKIVSDLITEANALLEMFDQVAMLLGPGKIKVKFVFLIFDFSIRFPDIKLHNVSGWCSA